MGNIFWRISREKSKIGLTDHTKFTKYKETFQEHIPGWPQQKKQSSRSWMNGWRGPMYTTQYLYFYFLLNKSPDIL